jgi:hypothetical protein
MSDLSPVILLNLSKAVLAAIQRDGRLPARLDEEDYGDLVQEGILAALENLDNYDPMRGTLRAYLSQPIARAQLTAAWGISSVGMTGNFDAVQVWGIGHNTDDDNDALFGMESPDPADEIEAFDHVWQTYYKNIPAN